MQDCELPFDILCTAFAKIKAIRAKFKQHKTDFIFINDIGNMDW